MDFRGFKKTSLIDFPDRVSSVLFTPGCNLRCPFCHNWRLIMEKGPCFSEKEAIQMLESRKKYVDSVVITGGEPTLNKDLPKFLSNLKEKGFMVKLDTNGFFPKILDKCLDYVDYVAMDVKTSLEKYYTLGSQSKNFLHTIDIIKKGTVEYEFRTTVVPGFVDIQDIPKIGKLVEGAKHMALQQFVSGDTLDKNFKVKPYPKEILNSFVEIIRKYVEKVTLRF
jgi:pyruvate formate lyase activating enzyme